jgi:PAS domain S-box-containing protein
VAQDHARDIGVKGKKRTQGPRSLVDGVPVALMRITRDGRVLDGNRAMVEMLGLPDRPSLLAANAATFCVNPDDGRRLLAIVDREELVRDFEVRFRRSDGTAIWVAIDVRAIRDEHAATVYYEAAARDVTERHWAEEALRHTEEQLRQARKMEAIGQLAGGIAHDFNNLLTVVLGRTQILQDRVGHDEPHRRHLELIQITAERAAGLSRQLLAFSSKQRIQPRILDVNQVVTSLVPMLRRMIGEHIDLHIRTAASPLRVRADIGQLEQVVINLVVNARDAMPDGGRAVIDTADVELTEATSTLAVPAAAGRYVRLGVTDTGTGISADVRERIFEPFFTTKGPGRGTGLGLSTVYGVVRQHEGAIGVDSEIGRGTRFDVYLPAIVSPADVTDDEVDATLPVGHETILLVEDETEVRSLAREILEVCGYAAVEAKDGVEAMQTWERQARRIDLLLTDVIMPGISGFELAELVRRSRADLPVLFMSGYAPEMLTQRHELNEIGPLLEKPFTPHALATRVREVLGAPRG